MSKSRPRSKPRNYLSRREQWRVFLIVMSLGLVLILMQVASNPKNYGWLFGRDQEQIGPAPPAEPPTAVAPIDDRVHAKPPDSEVPGAFFAPVPDDLQAEEDTSGEYFPGVKPKLLAAVRDDTTFRYDERHSWFNLLGVLQKTGERALEKGSLGRVTYFQLFEQTNEYRGKLVTVRGRIHRALLLKAPKNDIGLEQYYQLWVQPDDAHDYPIVVYCVELPKGFPTGMKVLEGAEITGFYFKRWAYKSQDMLRTAPTLAAKTVRWIQAPPGEQERPLGLGSVVFVVMVAAAFAAFAAAYVYTRTRRVATEEPETVPGLAALRDVEPAPGRDQPPGEQPEKQDESHEG